MDELRVIVLCEIDVDGPLLVIFQIDSGNILVRFPKGPTRGPQEGPKAKETLPWQCQSTEAVKHFLGSVNELCPSMQACRNAMSTA